MKTTGEFSARIVAGIKFDGEQFGKFRVLNMV